MRAKGQVHVREGPLFGGMISLAPSQNGLPSPRMGRGGGRSRGHAPFEKLLGEARREAGLKTRRGKGRSPALLKADQAASSRFEWLKDRVKWLKDREEESS